MKKMKYLLIILLIIFLVSGTKSYQKAKNPDIPSLNITVNEKTISLEKAQWLSPALPNILPDSIRDKWRIGGNRQYDVNTYSIKTDDHHLVIDSPLPYHISIYDVDNNIVYADDGIKDFAFTQSGHYTVTIIVNLNNQMNFDGECQLTFTTKLIVDLTPYLTISNYSPMQGELVEVNVHNVNSATTINVNCEFSESAILFDDLNNIAKFYIPITYYKSATAYPLDISITKNDATTDISNTLEVRSDDFTTTSFSASSDVVEETINSKIANQEYRETIHPLYYTKDSQKYWSEPFIKPVEEKRVSSSFGEIRYENNSKTSTRHSGIDYAAPLGTKVYAANTGKIEYAGFLKLSGNTIVIEHGLGLKSYYFHMDSLSVNTGDMVNIGDFVGTVGTTGYSTGPHLHYQVSIQNQPINPNYLYR